MTVLAAFLAWAIVFSYLMDMIWLSLTRVQLDGIHIKAQLLYFCCVAITNWSYMHTFSWSTMGLPTNGLSPDPRHICILWSTTMLHSGLGTNYCYIQALILGTVIQHDDLWHNPIHWLTSPKCHRIRVLALKPTALWNFLFLASYFLHVLHDVPCISVDILNAFAQSYPSATSSL